MGILPKNWYCPPLQLRVILSSKNCLSNFPRLVFFLSFCGFRNYVKENTSFEPQSKVEQKFANMQTVFDFFYQHLHQETISNWEQTKVYMGRGIMLIWKFVLKVINNERKTLTHHKIIDRIAEQICVGDNSSVQRIKFVDSCNLRRPSFSFILLSSLTFVM